MASWGCDLYVISCGELCKVGRSKHVAKRFKEIQRGMPFSDCHILAVFPGSGFCESWMHRALADYPRRGEWFRCDAQAVLCIVASHLSAL